MNKNEIKELYGIQSNLLEVIDLWKKTGVFYEPEDNLNNLIDLVNFDSTSIHIIKYKNTIIASAILVYNPFQSFIYRFSVLEKYRGNNIGKILSNFIESSLIDKGMFNPTIFVEDENENGLQFWKKRGWKILYKVNCLVKNLKN